MGNWRAAAWPCGGAACNVPPEESTDQHGKTHKSHPSWADPDFSGGKCAQFHAGMYVPRPGEEEPAYRKEGVIRLTYEFSIDKADKVTVSSPSGVSLECGESKIELLPSGIAIAAKAVTASGGASRLALESSGAEVKSEAVIIEAEGVCSVMGKNLLKLNTP